jgi:tRNA threonylcarbamoyladenosine biosynthesis protein TsaB
LALETTGSACSVAIRRGASVLAAERRPLRHGHAEVLVPMIERIVAAARLAPSDFDIVAVATGPGGFTGIRVGLAAAQGIGLAIGAPLCGVSSFAAAAAMVDRDDLSECAALVVALDSRRADLYVQLFAPDGATPAAGPEAMLPERLPAYLARFGIHRKARLAVAGDAAEAASGALAACALLRVLPAAVPDALGVAAAAMARCKADLPFEAARPIYLRPPDVTLPKPGIAATFAR